MAFIDVIAGSAIIPRQEATDDRVCRKHTGQGSFIPEGKNYESENRVQQINTRGNKEGSATRRARKPMYTRHSNDSIHVQRVRGR